MSSKTARSIRLRLTLVVSVFLLPFAAYLAVTGWLGSGEAGAVPPLAVAGPLLLWALALVIVWVATGFVLDRPIRRLSEAAEAYYRGEPAARLSVTGPVELRAFAVAFNELADRFAGRDSELREAIETREAMLREIHHRVKNNLQIVTSLLNLQAKAVQGDSGKRAFSDIQMRVRALALVHRYLYESDDLQSVNLGAFLQELAASIQLSHGMSQSQVAIEVEADAVWDISDRAVPLALFMTEAMTNALKHAFPQGRQGVIRIVLKSLAHGVVRFSVEDNGVGLTEAKELVQSGGPNLGMSLIKAFARQVDGKLTISGPPGTIVMIEFVNKYTRPPSAVPPNPVPRNPVQPNPASPAPESDAPTGAAPAAMPPQAREISGASPA
jgi:two-component sensor histidine kinase